MELNVYKADGADAGRAVTLDASVFDIEPNDHVLWLDVRRIQANGRQGTHKAKERNEVVGSTRKLYRQKGTGHARAGDAKSPIRKGGGTAFGPRPRSYGIKVNRKTQQLARRSALTYKAREEAIRVVEDFDFDQPRTRELREMLQAMDLGGQKVLVLTGAHAPNVHYSARNVPGVTVREARNVSTLDLLDAKVLVLQEGALAALTEQLGATETAE